jgi:hypothetical protein
MKRFETYHLQTAETRQPLYPENEDEHDPTTDDARRISRWAIHGAK